MEKRILKRVLDGLAVDTQNENKRLESVKSISKILEFSYKTYYKPLDSSLPAYELQKQKTRKQEEWNLIQDMKTQITESLKRHVERFRRSKLVDNMRLAFVQVAEKFEQDIKQTDSILEARAKKSVHEDMLSFAREIDNQLEIGSKVYRKRDVDRETAKKTFSQKVKEFFNRKSKEKEDINIDKVPNLENQELNSRRKNSLNSIRRNIGVPSPTAIQLLQQQKVKKPKESVVRRPVNAEGYEQIKPVGSDVIQSEEEWYQMTPNGPRLINEHKKNTTDSRRDER